MDIQIGNPTSFHYLWLVLIVAITMCVAVVARRRAIKRFGTADVIDSVLPIRRSRWGWLNGVLSLAALAALVVALTDIRWGKSWRDVPQKGIEVVFALDVSRSMLAEDVAPHRLGRAKQQIKDIVDEMAGDRVGLVVFAGEAVRKIPLTSHYNDFKRALDKVGPQDVTRGGSNLGGAVRTAANSFLAKTTDHKAIVLFTDGEDHESKPVQAAKQAYEEQGIRLFTVGLGDDRQGARVPAGTASKRDRFLEHDGQQVWSKLDGKTLKAMAIATGGAFIPAGTKQVDMAQVYHAYMTEVEQQDFATARINGYIPRFHWFVGFALLLTLTECLSNIWQRPRMRSATGQSTKHVQHMTRTLTPVLNRAAAILVACVFLGRTMTVEAADVDPFTLADKARAAMEAGEYEEALENYAMAARAAPDVPEFQYNHAVALHRKGDIEAARSLFTAVTATEDRKLEARARFNLGNCDYAEAMRLAEAKSRDEAKSKARAAISHYRGALAADPNDADARANIELAAILLRQLNEQEEQERQSDKTQQKQQDEKQPEQSTDQDSKEQDSQDQNDKQNSASNSSEQQSTEEEGSDQQSEAGEQSQADEASSPNEDQQSNSDQTESDNSQQSTANGEQQSKQQGDKPEPGENSETSSQPDRKPSQPQDASDGTGKEESAEQGDEHQSNDSNGIPPAGSLESANQDGDSKPTGSVTGADDIENGKPMTREEAMKMLQSVRDRELMRALQNARNAQRRYIPGDKDW